MQQCLVSTFGEKLLRHCLQMGYHNFGEQNNSHPFLLSSFPPFKVGVFVFFLQVAQTVASHCMDRVGRERFIFSFSS